MMVRSSWLSPRPKILPAAELGSDEPELSGMLIRNTWIYLFGEILNRGGKFLAIYMMATLMAKTEFGRYSFVLSICLVVLVFFDFGVNSLVILRTTWKRVGHLIPLFQLTKLVVTLFVCLALASGEVTFGLIDPIDGRNFTPFLLLCVGWDLQTFTGSALRARLNYVGEMVTKAIANVGFLLVLLVAVLIGLSLDLTAALWLQSAATIVGSIYGLLALRRGLKRWLPPLRHARRGLKSIVKIGAPMTLATSGGVLQLAIDSLVLGSNNYLDANASYTLVQRMGQFAQLPMLVVLFAALPYVVEQLKGGIRRPNVDLLRTIVMLLTWSGIAIGHFFVLAAEWAIPYALGDRYDDVGIYGAVLGLYIIPLYIYPVLTNLLSAMRLVVGVQSLAAASTMVSLILDLIVIRLYGPYAVAWVAVAVAWLFLVACIVFYRIRGCDWPIDLSIFLLAMIGTVTIALPRLMGMGSREEVLFRTACMFVAAAAGMCFVLKRRAQFRHLLSR